jgi:hypothetical protein
MTKIKQLLFLGVVAVALCAFPTSLTLAQQQDDEKEEEVAGKEQEKDDKDFEEPDKLTEQERKEIEKKACPEVDLKYKADTDKSTHPTPEPSPGKAMIYVIRPTKIGNKIQTKLAVDGEWKGTNRGNNYFFFELDPGEHYVCSKSENRSVLKFTVEAGKTYYLQQKIKLGFMKARNKVVLLGDEEGKTGLAKCHPSIFEVKK